MFNPNQQQVDSFSPSSIVSQNNSLLGNPQIQKTALPFFDPNTLNSTAFQSNPNVMNMVKALKGN